MPIKNLLKQLALASVLATTALMAQTPYDEGQKALREQRWMDAAGQFEQASKTDKDQADAAVYWTAYAYFKAGRKNEADRELRRLERKYPQSRWVKEGQALRIEHQDPAESIEQVTSDGSALDEDLRIFALAQMMERSPERALPLVLDLIRDSESQQIRQDALFVLALSEEPAAQQALAGLARDSSDPELQISAIHILGSASTETSLALLAEMYTDTAPPEVKKALIHAHIAGDEPGVLVAILKSEQNPELQREIIHALGAMDATGEIQAIYPTLSNRDNRIAAIEAFSIAGDSTMLKQVLDSETDPELRTVAIHGIGMADGTDSADYLQSLYETASDEEKSTILEALTMMDDAQDLAMQIVATEKNPELQRKAIHVLGIIDGTEKLGELYVSLNSLESRKAVLEAMSMADDSDGLLKVLQTEQDAELRAAAIRYLAITGGDSAAENLGSLYSSGSREEKNAVIEAMMIMEDAEALIGLLKQESDPELKRKMLQMLTLMDSEESDKYLFEMLEKKG